MIDIKAFADRDKFANHVGIKMLKASEGSASAELELCEHHFNGLGLAHGGAIFSLADLVFAAAANSHGIDAVAININISYFKAVKKGKLIAEAKEISLNRKLGTYSISITDETGDTVASFQGTAYRKTPKNT